MKKDEDKIVHYHPYFQPIRVHGDVALQTVSSGPEAPLEKIKMGYLRLINAAQDHIWIQTPYLIPDDSILDALRVAAHSGIDVRIMIPCKPDHPFVYRATQYYAQSLAAQGGTKYTYQKGFLQSKTMKIDGRLATGGSANLDLL